MTTLSIRERGSMVLSVSVDGPDGEESLRVRADPCDTVCVLLQRAVERSSLRRSFASRCGLFLKMPSGGATDQLPAISSLAECGVTASSSLLVRHRGTVCFSLRTDQLNDKV